ncbi:alkylation response protein AidB-like acyl-CoA dehydrogenase [Melghiribacillus thermohalophilus]|uniref:Alkylation response protein AidB-like acyl-CoA dehydrogenase n=1 Tax=Melghiribacillus thermohalophilus TaxID=1324956 RepID=A0A4R3N2I2_9BACI|nr:acyl-CoA dehydrogenase family protein [Melghiribacillus thermohalophilus]TCT20879.1 alkylation response protein AidB-like acyl-CoA dehydrogenase [Melghiribacillus thermohalophilus]
MSKFYDQEAVLLRILKDKLDPELYEYAVQELETFYDKCYEEFDPRAVHTDREGQPKLIKYNRFGDDVSEIWVNEGYQKTVEDTYNAGIVGYVHKPIPELGRKGNYLYSYAQGYLLSQVEPGFYCPVTLTMAVAYLIDHFADDHLRETFLPHVLSTGEVELYEGATFLTERQGGSDVGANEVKAVQDGDGYRLFGEKYFASNAGQCGVAAVLARIEGSEPGTKGLSLFLVPWRKEDGSINDIQVRRLKDKLGVRAVPSAEIVFEGSRAYLVGDPKKGFYYMMEALNLSRVCNAIASVGIMKRALKEAHEYAGWREAFGNKIIQYPMVKETLTNLQARYEIQLSALYELIEMFDQVMNDRDRVTDEQVAMNRLLIALLKARTADEAIDFSHEAIEMHGGNGYIEDFVTPRLLRDAQVLTVWEGTANILGLEVLRLIKKYQVHELFFKKIHQMLDGSTMDQTWLQPIQKKMKKLQTALQYLQDQDEDAQTYHAKRLANMMTDIYLAAHAIERAETERDETIAKLMIDHLFGDYGLDEDMLPVKKFAEIMKPESKSFVNS